MKQSKSQKVMKYVAKHPNAKASEIAKATGVDTAYVYTIISKAKKGGKLNPLPLTGITPKQAKDLAFQISQGRSKMRGRPPRMKTIAGFVSDTPIATRMATAADNVNHPSHYKTGGIETIDFIEAKGLDYHLGNVVKYITRAEHKGNRKEDLLKAQWYLNRAISKLEK
jgi:hypothetical protein